MNKEVSKVKSFPCYVCGGSGEVLMKDATFTFREFCNRCKGNGVIKYETIGEAS